MRTTGSQRARCGRLRQVHRWENDRGEEGADSGESGQDGTAVGGQNRVSAGHERGVLILALMIGELKHQPTVNGVTTEIVHHAVRLWREAPDALLACESEPMAELAAHLGIPRARLRTAIVGVRRHTTRLVAEWLRDADETTRKRQVLIVTHRLHAERARRVFAKVGIHTETVGLDIPFRWPDRDWKLRSSVVFSVYNVLAHAYCACRGWV
jgi:DUF218 domain